MVVLPLRAANAGGERPLEVVRHFDGELAFGDGGGAGLGAGVFLVPGNASEGAAVRTGGGGGVVRR